MTSPLDRAAAAAVADDLARCVRLRCAGLGLGARPFPSRVIALLVGLAPCGRTPLLAFIVFIEKRAFRADDFAAVVAVGLEAVLADQRADPRRLELDGIECIETCKLDVEF